MLAYNVPFFNDGDTQAFLTAVARATGRLRKVSHIIPERGSLNIHSREP